MGANNEVGMLPQLHSLDGSRVLPWLLGGQASGVHEPAGSPRRTGTVGKQLHMNHIASDQPIRSLTDVKEASRPGRRCHEADGWRAQHLHDARQLVALVLTCGAAVTVLGASC